MKKILVIGGTYFLGRIFCMMASQQSDIQLSVLNRGTYKLQIPDVKEYHMNRHEMAKMNEQLPDGEGFDAIVDFCAYFPEEIKMVIDSIPGAIKQYIYISTGSVYAPADGKRDESAAVVSEPPRDKVEEHVHYKLELEKELLKICKDNNTQPTIIRPACIYGPFNYVPREAFLFSCLFSGDGVPNPVDATGRFSMAYVGDVAKAVFNAIGNEKAYGEIFNVAGPEEVTYPMIMELMHKFHGDFKTNDVTVEEAVSKQIPLAFPLTKNELYDGSKAEKLLGIKYTTLDNGLHLTYEIHRDLFNESANKGGDESCDGECCESCGGHCGE